MLGLEFRVGGNTAVVTAFRDTRSGLRLTLGLGQRYEPYNLAVSLALEVVTEKDIGLMVSTTGRLLPCHMFLG